jgi:DNA (cytosine-5)-methyltransferase 1
MNALSLFSGIGGIDLAAEWAGIETVAFCEREPFCQKVLAKHWPNIPIYDDVCTLTKERLEADGIDTRSIGLVHGGYPCQPFSVAGERKGKDDDRHLWPQVKRILQEIRPRWFVGENVAGHISMGLDEVLSDLENISYTTQSFIIPACGVGAMHRRDRVFVVANSNSQRFQEWANTGSSSKLRQRAQQQFQGLYAADTWSNVPSSEFSRKADGISDKLDRSERTHALGNAVFPAQIYPILAAIKQINDMKEEIT